jgi:hypothetical protein
MELLRFPWLANHLLRRVESTPPAWPRGERHAIDIEMASVKALAAAVEACGRSCRKGRADYRAARERLDDAREDWEISYLALKRRSRAVPGMAERLFGETAEKKTGT